MNNVLRKKFRPQLLLSDFLEEAHLFVQEYSCPLCEGILSESVIDACGHSYCRACILTLMKETRLCPFTNVEILSQGGNEETLSSNIIVNSILEKQRVFCKNKCDWTGKLMDLKNHILYDCPIEQVDCEFFPQCREKFKRLELANHVNDCPQRSVTCYHCKEKVSFYSLEKHYETCAYFPISCKNECGKSIPNIEMEDHIENFCENTLIDCPYTIVGCEYQESRKLVKCHLVDDLEAHLKMLNKKIGTLELQLRDQKSKIDSVFEENTFLKNELSEIKRTIMKNKEDLDYNLNMMKISINSLKLYSNIPHSTCHPNFYEKDIIEQTKDIFKLNKSETFIKKIQKNYGWYGISSKVIEFNETDKIIINIKINKTSSSCIMFGLTSSVSKSPLQNGFYIQTEDENISCMLYLYNTSVYFRGRALNKGDSLCLEGDIITLIIEKSGRLVFRRNGVQVSESFPAFSPEKLNKLRVAIDLSDYEDCVMFI
jgi:hypothetical protein